MNEQQQRSRIIAIDAENFMRLTAAHARIDPEKGLIRVTGKNGAGKTSLLRAVQAVFGGAGAVVEQPIHEGATDTSYVKVTLNDGWSIERRFTPASPKGYLTVVAPDGGKHGQRKLDDWLGSHSFDPLAFFSLTPAKRRDVLLSLSGDPDLGDKLVDLEDRRAEIYEGRTPYIVQKRTASKVEKPDGERPEPVDVTEEFQRLHKLQSAQQARKDLEREVYEADHEIARCQSRIRELEEQLKRARLDEQRAKERHHDLKEEWEHLGDPASEIAAVQARIEAANAVTESLGEWRRWDEAQAQIEEADERVEECTRLIQGIDQEKDRLLTEAGLPVPNLTFNSEGDPLLNGLPLEQAGGREKIEVAVAVAMAANPQLRVCLLDEANDLDIDGLRALDELAKEHDFQVIAVRIGLEGAGEIVVEDGEARGVEP